ELPLTGIVDRLVLDRNTVEVIETKRGSKIENCQHEWQVRLLMALATEKWPEYQVKGSLYYTKSRRRKEVTFNQGHLDEIWRSIRAIQDGVQAGTFQSFPK